MDAGNLFASAPGLNDQWEIAAFGITGFPSRLDMQMDFKPGEKFTRPHCAQACPIHDTKTSQWQHLNFWQYPTFLTTRVLWVKCPQYSVNLNSAVEKMGMRYLRQSYQGR